MLAAPAQPRLPQIPPRSAAAAPSRLPMNPFGPAAAKPSANWDVHHAGVPHRRRSPKVPGFPQRSEASRSSSIVAVAPDPTEPKPCSRLPICLQINQQTIAGKVAARKAALTGGLRFNGRLRDELLNETLFSSLAQARVALGCWRADYNGSRPHSQLGWKTPSEYAFTFHPRRDLALRYAKGSAPAAVAPTAKQGNPKARSELTAG